MMDLAIATSALSAANRVAATSRYKWVTTSLDGDSVKCSDGMLIPVDAKLSEVSNQTRAFVLAFDDAHQLAPPELLAWLRKTARHGLAFGAFGTGATVLANAGLICGREFTMHWTAHPAYCELNPERPPRSTLFTVDGRLFTCAGGQSSADMMLAILSRDANQAFGARVAEYLLGPAPRSSSTPQRQACAVRFGTRNPHFLAAIDLIDADDTCEITVDDLLANVGVSRRQLERLFRKYCATSPARYLKDLRLDRGRDLLDKTNLQVIEISIAVGFPNVANFSKSFAKKFGCTPSRYRV